MQQSTMSNTWDLSAAFLMARPCVLKATSVGDKQELFTVECRFPETSSPHGLRRSPLSFLNFPEQVTSLPAEP